MSHPSPPLPYAPPRPNNARHLSTTDLELAGRRTLLLTGLATALAIFGVLGGWEWITGSVPADGEVAVLRWPFSVGYFLPLLVPLSLYVVIARWTGDKLFRHS